MRLVVSAMHLDAADRKSELAEIRKLFGTTDGVQVQRIRRPQKQRRPPWAWNEKDLRKQLIGPALRRYRIAYMYWLVGMNAREIAEEMKTTTNAIECVIHKLNRKQSHETV
jgi:hypothetical protein